MQNLDSAFSALADPTRRAILARLALGELTVMELAKPFAMTMAGGAPDPGFSQPCSMIPWKSAPLATPLSSEIVSIRSGGAVTPSSVRTFTTNLAFHDGT